jgi:putative transposase
MRPYVRRTKTLEATLPWLYLKGISSGEMGAALKGLLGSDAAGLSANMVSRPRCYLSGACKAGCRKGAIGPRNTMAGKTLRTMTSQSSTSGPTASTAAFEASTISYAPKLAIGPFHRLQANGCRVVDGAMGFWAVLDEVYHIARHQRCWQHKTMNMLNCLPKLSQPKAKAAIHNISQAETKDDVEKAFHLFVKIYEHKYPKATLCLQKDREELMAFFDFPAQHWQSIRPSNPIESAFANIRHRTKRSKGCLSRAGMLHMMFKPGKCAEQNRRKLRGFDCLAKVITGVTFKDGIETTKPDQIAA